MTFCEKNIFIKRHNQIEPFVGIVVL